MDDQGLLNERLPGDPLYWDSTDPRPWGTWLNESDERLRAAPQGRGTPGIVGRHDEFCRAMGTHPGREV